MIRLMKHGFILICALALPLKGCHAPTAKPDLSFFFENHKAAVFVFLAPDCPLSRNYTLTLNKLHAQFRDAGVGFYGLVAGDAFQKNDIDGFNKEYKMTFPLLPDRNFALADLWGAMKTPEAFVVNAGGKVIYKGAIDNWSAELGQYRTVITRHYLRDVLTDFLRGRDVSYRETAAIGCFIERKG